MNYIEYLETAKKEIREGWFKNHKIKKIEGAEGFQRIVWGIEDTNRYQVNYVFSGNKVFISGDIGDAIYSLTSLATLENIKGYDLSYFTKKITASQHDVWDFDEKAARREIKETFFNWCEVENVDDLEDNVKELYNNLTNATRIWSDAKAFKYLGVWNAYESTDVDWFDTENASIIADCGKRLSYSIIAYWVGLQMIVKELGI